MSASGQRAGGVVEAFEARHGPHSLDQRFDGQPGEQ